MLLTWFSGNKKMTSYQKNRVWVKKMRQHNITDVIFTAIFLSAIVWMILLTAFSAGASTIENAVTTTLKISTNAGWVFIETENANITLNANSSQTIPQQLVFSRNLSLPDTTTCNYNYTLLDDRFYDQLKKYGVQVNITQPICPFNDTLIIQANEKFKNSMHDDVVDFMTKSVMPQQTEFVKCGDEAKIAIQKNELCIAQNSACTSEVNYTQQLVDLCEDGKEQYGWLAGILLIALVLLALLFTGNVFLPRLKGLTGRP